MSHLLEVKNLSVYFYTYDGLVKAVDQVSFHLDKGKTLGMVGESGCGKSVTSLSIMGLLPLPPARIESGEIFFEGTDLLKKKEWEMRKIRGNNISMIFQEPVISLNPVFTIGDQITEAIKIHENIPKREAEKKAVEMLRLVGIPIPERRMREYPHNLSGGMCQRVMIAIALCCNPKLLIADEPTTALDVTIQEQIIQLINDLKKRFDMAVLIITHDLGVIVEMVERVLVMYAGRIVEELAVNDLFEGSVHPYTRGLLKAIPRLDQSVHRLSVIEGEVPNPSQIPEGCNFHPRCKYAKDICKKKPPVLKKIGPDQKVACWLSDAFS